jgi:hypothetical protein
MEKQDLAKIINYLIGRGLETIKNNTEGVEVVIDYVAIFAKNDEEFNRLNSFAKTLGKEVDMESAKTGHTYELFEPLQTSVGLLKLVKIRKPDQVRPQRGAPDFKVKNYQEFKNKYIRSSGNFTLMLRKDYEMIEIKGIDVYVYIPDRLLTERMKL